MLSWPERNVTGVSLIASSLSGGRHQGVRDPSERSVPWREAHRLVVLTARHFIPIHGFLVQTSGEITVIDLDWGGSALIFSPAAEEPISVGR